MVNEFTEEESIQVRIQGNAGGRGDAPFPPPPMVKFHVCFDGKTFIMLKSHFEV